MKVVYFSIALQLLILPILFAQESAKPEYLIDLAEVKLSGFGNTHGEFSVLDGNFSYSSGASGAFLFNYKYFLGIYNLSLQTMHLREDIYPADHNPGTVDRDPLYSSNRVRFNHGGLWVGYIHNPNNLVHFGGNLRIGKGTISLFDKDLSFITLDEHHRDFVGVITPEIDVEVNLARWCKIGVSVGYRYVFGVNDDVYINSAGESIVLFESSKFSSPVASVKLYFGAFGPKNRNGK